MYLVLLQLDMLGLADVYGRPPLFGGEKGRKDGYGKRTGEGGTGKRRGRGSCELDVK